jgi:uncharacterized short protein YbdD (DUF466 family)
MNRYGSEVRKAWQFIRELTTDDAYETYLARHRATHPDVPPLSRREFFTSEQCRKWSGIQRCC